MDYSHEHSGSSVRPPKVLADGFTFLEYSFRADMSNVFNHFYEFGNFQLDPTRRLLWKNSEVISLAPKAFDTLLVLVESGGRVLDKEELLREVWGGLIVEEVGLAKNISALRKA